MSGPPDKPLPRPGSPQAVREGCTCPILDNAHGRGVLGMEFNWWINFACPLHGEPLPDDPATGD